jgi:YD repeat-containing protein
VDQLTYSYQSNIYKPTQVADGIVSLSYKAKDFKDRGTTEYGYDANGNLTSNEDKQITTIAYNHLNLPKEITFTSGAKIRFAYDAAGMKLTQKVYDASGTLTKTQDYIGEIVLLDGALDYLLHEERRLVVEPDGLWGEYYLKDHLGNICQVLRAATSQTFMATMETQNAASEELAFSQVSASRQTEPAHNVTVGGNQVAWLNADRGRMVGPGRTQEIYSGDSLKLQVYGKYLDDKNQKINVGSFATQGAKDKLINDLNELAESTQRAGGGNPIALFNLAYILTADLQKKEAPEAYLIYALYDRDSNRYEVGKKVLSKNAANQHEVLEEELYISKDGYMETFVPR